MADEDLRALSNVGGEVRVRGDGTWAVPLRAALEAQDGEPDRLTHGFHAYPARMHPGVAGTLLEHLAQPGATVVDPCCGSGTVLVEAMRAQWRSLGSDLDPLAVRLARVKTSLRSPHAVAGFRGAVAAVGEASEKRVRGRVDVRADLSADERSWYEVHVLKEMAGLLEEIRKVEEEADRSALEMVFSSLVVKFSKQRSETNLRREDKRIRKGLVTEFFVRKADELAQRWTALRSVVPRSVRRPRFVQADARRLPQVLGGTFNAQLVLTSPPYGGTYDYAFHHERRHAWLGLKTANLRKLEIGARRQLGAEPGRDPKQAVERWGTQVDEFLDGIAGLLGEEGLAVLLVGDAEVGGVRIDADQHLEQRAERHGFEWVAAANQLRPDFRGGPKRREHLVALRRKPDPRRR